MEYIYIFNDALNTILLTDITEIFYTGSLPGIDHSPGTHQLNTYTVLFTHLLITLQVAVLSALGTQI